MKLFSRLFVLVEIVQKRTNLGTLSPFCWSYGLRTTLVDGSLESPCRALVKCNGTSFSILAVEALQGKMCQYSLPSGEGRSLTGKISGGRGRPLPIYWCHSKGNWLRYNFVADIFCIMKLCSRLFVLYCRNYPKDDKFRYIIPILRKLGRRRTSVDGSLESPCRVLVKRDWTSFSISYGWGATRQKVSRLAVAAIRSG